MTRSLEPQHIDETNWYYEEAKGIEILHEVRNEDGFLIRTDQVLIPWQKLRASLNRRDARKAKP